MNVVVNAMDSIFVLIQNDYMRTAFAFSHVVARKWEMKNRLKEHGDPSVIREFGLLN